MDDASQGKRRQDSLMSASDNRSMFNRIAGYYDGTNRLLSVGFDRYWRRRAVASLAPKAGGTYLDVGSGTGDIALEILRQSPESIVTGIDPSQAMLVIGREKIEGMGLARSITLTVGDALDLQFRDYSFDGVITSFCIRNVTDRRRALEECHRVLRPGGKFVILELTDPGGPIMKPLFRIYSNAIIPLVTKVLSSASAYRYLTDSMADFPRAERFVSLMREVGFVDTGHIHMTGGITTIFSGTRAPGGTEI
jgi:demethylmenaquinone methyltransferase/2-methoxy-6-polyprenyl-1,4-benzoquinol methylase